MAYAIDVKEKELKGEIYEKFIKEAIRCSDMLYLNIYWPKEGDYKKPSLDWINSSSEEMLLKVTGHTKNELYELENVYEQEFYTEREEFWKETAPFLDALEPYILFIKSQETRYYKVCPEMEPLLLQPSAIMSWRYPHFPDSPCFCKDNFLWFVSVIDEESVGIYTKTKKELDNWIELGIPYYRIREIELNKDDFTVYYDKRILN